MRNRKAEQREAREESIRRLAECVVRHEANGDHVQAAIFAELLVEATDRLAVADMVPEIITIEPTSEQMRAEVKRKLDAGERLGATHTVLRGPPDTLTIAKLKPSDKPRWPCRGDERKHVGEKYCGGITCLPGKNGKCVACAEDQ